MLSLVIGSMVGYGVLPPEVITETEYIYITETEYVDVIQPLRQFDSVAELQDWLKNDYTNEYKWLEDLHDCDDFAEDLVRAANKDGYEMFTISGNVLTVGELSTYGYYNVYEVSILTGEGWNYEYYDIVFWEEITPHAWNYVIIHGRIYYIEPQTDQIYYHGTEL